MNIDGLGRDELITLQSEIKTRLKTFKPFKIKQVMRKCGIATCYCVEGIDLHGPYLFASWREGGKTKTASLGRHRTQSELEDMRQISYPDLKDYFTVNPDQHAKLTHEDAIKLRKYKLTAQQFEDRYGVTKADDKFGRYDHFFGTEDQYDQYHIDCDLASEKTAIPDSLWAWLGVGTLKGLAVIQGLEARGFYFKG